MPQIGNPTSSIPETVQQAENHYLQNFQKDDMEAIIKRDPQQGVTLYTGGGNDVVYVTEQDDGSVVVNINDEKHEFTEAEANSLTIDSGNGNDTVIVSGNINVAIRGQDGDDYIRGGDGNDNIDGGKGNDNLVGGAGNDIMRGGRGDDYMLGGLGNDVMYGNLGKDFMRGQTGDDVVKGGWGRDDVHDDFGVDKKTGGDKSSWVEQLGQSFLKHPVSMSRP